ncbi:MAG: acireductone synthase [Thermoplasmatales archaeon]|nr:acireductone synthase [Thermoplasmatales archaeon]
MGLVDIGINSVILDIEGTTTPIEFVHSTLFDYVKENVATFLHSNYRRPEIAGCIERLRILPDLPLEFVPADKYATENFLNRVSSAIRYLVEKDSKTAPLKEIEGFIWEEGYRNGSIRGEVYDDVPEAFKKWRGGSIGIYIYSSGSALSQRLLFSTTVYGDLAMYIDGFFDMSVGKKTDPESYSRIAKKIGKNKKNLIFISDSEKEIRAARESGMNAILINRNPTSDSKNTSEGFIKDFKDSRVIP